MGSYEYSRNSIGSQSQNAVFDKKCHNFVRSFVRCLFITACGDVPYKSRTSQSLNLRDKKLIYLSGLSYFFLSSLFMRKTHIQNSPLIQKKNKIYQKNYERSRFQKYLSFTRNNHHIFFYVFETPPQGLQNRCLFSRKESARQICAVCFFRIPLALLMSQKYVLLKNETTFSNINYTNMGNDIYSIHLHQFLFQILPYFHLKITFSRMLSIEIGSFCNEILRVMIGSLLLKRYFFHLVVEFRIIRFWKVESLLFRMVLFSSSCFGE